MYSLEDPPSESLLLSLGIDEWIDKNTSPDYLRERIEEWGGIRTYSVVKEGEHFVIKKEMPMDAKHAEEIRELAKKGLVKMNLRGIGEHETIVTVHKNIPNKIARDFIERDQDIVTFIDRNEDRPAICHLYKSSCPMPSLYISPEELADELKHEDDDLKGCSKLVFKRDTSGK